MDGTNTPFNLNFSAQDEASLGFKLSVDENRGNFLSLAFKSDTDEEIYGLGLQYTVWNFKGKKVPLIVNEGGVGRGLQPITKILNA